MNTSRGFSKLVRALGHGLADGETIERPLDTVPLERIGPIVLVKTSDDPRLDGLNLEVPDSQLPAICWDYSLEDEGVASQDDILEAFLRLRGGEPEKYLAFACRYGPLMVCGHGLPPGHQPDGQVGNIRYAGCRCARIEPLQVWEVYVEMFESLLTLAALIEGPKLEWSEARELLWKRAMWFTGRDEIPWWKPSVRADRRVLQLTLEQWLSETGVRPQLRREREELRIRLGGGGVFGALTLQATLAVARSQGLAFCSECQMAYSPTRRPNPNCRNYCPACREAGVPNRDAQRAWRARQQP